MTRKKLVHITSSLKRGGAELVLATLVLQLSDTFEQTVLYVHDGPQRAAIEVCGVPCIQVKGALHTYDPLFFTRLYKKVRQIQPDVIHTLLWAATVAGRCVGAWLQIPVVSAYHGNVDQDGSIRNFFDRRTFFLSQTNIAVSSGVADSVRLLVPRSSFHVIQNGIAPKIIPSSRVRADIECLDEHFVIGAVGRFVSIKRFDVLIDVCALLRARGVPVRLCLIGVGPEYASLQAKVAKYNLQEHVRFLVDVQAIEYYHLFDCFVLPSPREGISMALLEALRAEVPAVVVSSEKHPVIMHGTNGLIVARPDALLIGDAVMSLYHDKAYARTIACAGRKTICTTFNQEMMVAAYKSIFTSIGA